MNCGNQIAQGADQPGVDITITNDDDTPANLSGYTEIELHFKDIYNIIEAKYIMPFSSQPGYHELALSDDNSSLILDIFAADSANFRRGKLLMDIYLTTAPLTDYPDGAKLEIPNIFLTEIV